MRADHKTQPKRSVLGCESSRQVHVCFRAAGLAPARCGSALGSVALTPKSSQDTNFGDMRGFYSVLVPAAHPKGIPNGPQKGPKGTETNSKRIQNAITQMPPNGSETHCFNTVPRP